MGEGGFEPPKPKQQIYSLPHLTALEFPHMKFGAGGRIRTPDLLITNQLLYQLSYTSSSNSRIHVTRHIGICQQDFNIFLFFLLGGIFVAASATPSPTATSSLYPVRTGDHRGRRLLDLQRQPDLLPLSHRICPVRSWLLTGKRGERRPKNDTFGTVRAL